MRREKDGNKIIYIHGHDQYKVIWAGLTAIMLNYYQRMLDSHTKSSNHLVSDEKTKTERSLEKVGDSTKVLC